MGYIWASIYLADGRRTARSRKVSKLRDRMLWISDRYEIWQAVQQRCCRGACQIPDRLEMSKPEFRVLETSRDLTVRRPSAYSIEPQSSAVNISGLMKICAKWFNSKQSTLMYLEGMYSVRCQLFLWFVYLCLIISLTYSTSRQIYDWVKLR